MAAVVGAGSQRRVARCHQRGDLRQRRQIGADLGALGRGRQHLAAGIHHIGEGGLADLGVAEEIRQEAQVDVGDGDAGVEAGMRHRDRHEGLRAAEFGRRVIDAVGDGFGEAQVAGEIRAARDQDRGAGQPQQFVAVAAQQRQLADRGHAGQQLGVVGAVLFEADGAGAGHPADLAFEIGDRGFDPLGGRLGLFRHRVGQRGLGGAVADPGFERAVDRQHEHDEADQRDDVFGEQALRHKADFVLDPDHPDPRKAAPGTGIRAAAFIAVSAIGLSSIISGGVGRASAKVVSPEELAPSAIKQLPQHVVHWLTLRRRLRRGIALRRGRLGRWGRRGGAVRRGKRAASALERCLAGSG